MNEINRIEGRAHPSHGWGRRFNPYRAHHFLGSRPQNRPQNAALCAAVLALGLAACAGITPQPANPRIVTEIETACLGSGVFKTVAGVGLSFVPVPGFEAVASMALNAGVDRVCADPVRFAADITTVEWVLKNTGQKKVGS